MDDKQLMVIEVNFGKNKTDQIVVKFNDTPENLAKVKFGKFFTY